MWSFFRNIIQLIILPDNGWEDISRTSVPARAILGAMWTMAIVSLSPLVRLVYDGELSWLLLVQETIITAVTYGITYFLAGFLLEMWLPRFNGGEENKSRIVIFNSYIISVLSLQVLIANILPISFAILTLWPIYVAIIMWRGMKFMNIDDRETGKFIAAVIVALILPSQLLYRLFLNVI